MDLEAELLSYFHISPKTFQVLLGENGSVLTGSRVDNETLSSTLFSTATSRTRAIKPISASKVVWKPKVFGSSHEVWLTFSIVHELKFSP